MMLFMLLTGQLVYGCFFSFELQLQMIFQSMTVVQVFYSDYVAYFCRSGSGGHDEKPSNVLFFTVYNPKYPISVVSIHIK